MHLTRSFAFWAVLPGSIAAVAGDSGSRHFASVASVAQQDWQQLNESVSGRLAIGKPIANPCYLRGPDGKLQVPDLAACIQVQQNKGSSDFLGSHFSGYDSPNWASCQSNGSSCALDSFLPDLITPIVKQCQQGSVPRFYIDVRDTSDVQAGLAFAQKHNIRLVIKNTGHDYKGRSSGPDSLALWMHNVQPPIQLTANYTPEGCPAAPVGDVVTFGAGQRFQGIYDFVQQQGRMFVGGTSDTVGAAGGWIAGGGHSILSPTMGLGVDNVQQLKAVLPNGTYVTANRCQNQDLFFALRGGGGGTFGVVMEMTSLVFPAQTFEMASFVLGSLDNASVAQLLSIMVDNADKWAQEGWGGFVNPAAITNHASSGTFATSSLSHEEAVLSMKPLTDFVSSLKSGNIAIRNEITSGNSLLDVLNDPLMAGVNGVSSVANAMASRLIPRKYFQGDDNKKNLSSILSEAMSSNQQGQAISLFPMLINITPPASYQLPTSDQPGNVGEAAVTPAWRNSLWHVISLRTWDLTNTDPAFISSQYRAVTNSLQALRDFTPEGGAYQNEGDTFEPDPATAFWGAKNYERLLAIKKDVDPTNMLTCHQCIGWDSTDPRFGCYPAV